MLGKNCQERFAHLSQSHDQDDFFVTHGYAPANLR
jgi:hypothetical protein